MAGERGTESETGRVGRRVIVVGAPGVGKDAVRDEFVKHLEGDWDYDYDLARQMPTMYDKNPLSHHALGLLADYRVELKLAMDRTFQAMSSYEGVSIATHSLIDSLAYATLRLETYDRHRTFEDGSADKWIITVTTVSMLLRDSGRYDLILFVKGAQDEESKAVEERLEEILDGFAMPYVLVDPQNLSELAEAAKLLGEGHGERRATSETATTTDR